MNREILSSLKVGDTFEYLGKLWKVSEITKITDRIVNLTCHRMHKSKGYTFGKSKNFPFSL